MFCNPPDSPESARSALAKWPQLASVSDTDAPKRDRFVRSVGPTERTKNSGEVMEVSLPIASLLQMVEQLMSLCRSAQKVHAQTSFKEEWASRVSLNENSEDWSFIDSSDQRNLNECRKQTFS